MMPTRTPRSTTELSGPDSGRVGQTDKTAPARRAAALGGATVRRSDCPAVRLTGVSPRSRTARTARRAPAVGQSAERLEPTGLLDRSLGLQIETEVAGAPDELEIAHRAVPMNEERHLRLERRALQRTLPAPQHLAHDVLQVLGERERDALGADRGDVGAG